MFVTAHRVVSPTGRVGINAFLYTHGEGAGVDWVNADPALIAERQPGDLVRDDVEVVPGGNAVRSYLDVVARDNAPVEVLIQALDSFRDSSLTELPAVRRGEPGIRFGAEIGLPPDAIPGEFDTLRARVERILKSPPGLDWRQQEPLTIEMRRSEGETWFQFADAAVQRLRSVAGAQWTSARIRVRDEVRDDIALLHGDILRELVRALLGNIREEDVLRLGGVRVVAPDGALVAEWPIRRAFGMGYCLSCHQHNTLVPDAAGWRCAVCGQTQDNNGLWVATLT